MGAYDQVHESFLGSPYATRDSESTCLGGDGQGGLAEFRGSVYRVSVDRFSDLKFQYEVRLAVPGRKHGEWFEAASTAAQFTLDRLRSYNGNHYEEKCCSTVRWNASLRTARGRKGHAGHGC